MRFETAYCPLFSVCLNIHKYVYHHGCFRKIILYYHSYFSQLLHLDAYIYPVLLGCVVSVGGLTESLVLHAGETMANFFHEVTEDENLFQRVADATLQVWGHLKHNRRRKMIQNM